MGLDLGFCVGVGAAVAVAVGDGEACGPDAVDAGCAQHPESIKRALAPSTRRLRGYVIGAGLGRRPTL